MLKIKEKEPYIIIPRQRYDLSTLEPHNVMSGNFTFFVDFNLDSTEFPREYAIVARPGMHMGIMIKVISETYSYISWDFWVHESEETNWHNLKIDLRMSEDNFNNDRYFVLIQHDSTEKKFKMYVKPHKSDDVYETELNYDGILVDYTETPYNLGCGNYSKIVPSKDRLFSSVTIYKLGLLSNLNYSYEDISQFIKDTETDKIKLSKELLDLVFYFNFNAKNIYKVWDLSGHCNFIQKNLYIEDEGLYLDDEDFHKDYI